MRYSKQREVIYHAVLKNAVHPTADMVYGMLRTEHPNLSLATVYRNLNLLSANGMLVKLPVPGESDRFDGNSTPHYHMICTDCGQIFDIPLSCLDNIEQEAEESTGFQVTAHHLILYGLCVGCQKTT